MLLPRSWSALVVALLVCGNAYSQPAPVDALPRPGRDQVVALLPLDAPARLALYGHPIASEVARALSAAGITVVVVGVGAAVPARTALVVGGKLVKGSRNAVTIAVRVRDPRRGIELAQLSVRAESLAVIDQAAADISTRLVPEVRRLLLAERPGGADAGGASTSPGAATAPPRASPSARPSFDIHIGGRADAAGWHLGQTLGKRVWDLGWQPNVTGNPIGTAGTSLTVWAMSVKTEPGPVPLAWVRCRARLVHNGKTVFDQVIHTDTLVGARGSSPTALVNAAAEQLMLILSPRLPVAPTTAKHQGLT